MSLKKIKRAEKKGTESVMDEKFALLFWSEFPVGNSAENCYQVQLSIFDIKPLQYHTLMILDFLFSYTKDCKITIHNFLGLCPISTSSGYSTWKSRAPCMGNHIMGQRICRMGTPAFSCSRQGSMDPGSSNP